MEPKGIVKNFVAYPEHGHALSLLAETLMVTDEGGLSRYERETLAAYISKRNRCDFCYHSHRAMAESNLARDTNADPQFLDVVIRFSRRPGMTDTRHEFILRLSEAVRENDVYNLIDARLDAEVIGGLTEQEIHQVVLITSAFSMYNRYVHGMDTGTTTLADCGVIGEHIADNGYMSAR